MKIDTFGVEMWMNEWETKCEFNLAETCVESLTIDQLFQITGKNKKDLSEILSLKMTYGEIKGSDRLRKAIAALYEKQSLENVLVTHGTIGANMLVHKTLVDSGERVVSIVPTYQQHFSIPKSIGADVHFLQLREENNWLPDLDELKRLVIPETKLIALTNPNNPTGSLIDKEMLNEIADIANTADCWILCDEVYRGTNQSGPEYTVSIADLYDKGISTGSMSKTYSLAGLRLGWIVSSHEILKMIFRHRDYNTISVGMINDYCASIALENRERISERNIPIIRGNLRILDNWVKKEKNFSYIKPKGGTTALLKYDYDIPSRDFCIDILKNTGVLFAPGSTLNMEGWIRIGYANDPEILKTGLEKVSKYLLSLESH